MGFWSWLTGKKTRTTSVDRIYLRDSAHLNGLTNSLLAATRPVLLLAHFPATLKAIGAALDDAGATPTILGPTISTTMMNQLAAQGMERIIYAGVVRQLQPNPFPNPDEQENGLLEIFVAERHFLRSEDDVILQFAEGLKRRCHVSFHLSLEAPLLRQFAGEWVQGMLERLGMKEDECLESDMVSRRIRNTQENFAKRIDVPRETESAETWLLDNGLE